MPERGLVGAIGAGVIAAAIVALLHRLAPASGLLAYLGALSLLGTALAVLVARRLSTPPTREDRTVPTTAGMRLPPLTRIARLCDAAAKNADEARRRLRPRLARIAEDTLAVHSVELRDPAAAERARQLLGDEAWAWVRPDATEPAGEARPAADPAALGRVVDALERLQAAP